MAHCTLRHHQPTCLSAFDAGHDASLNPSPNPIPRTGPSNPLIPQESKYCNMPKFCTCWCEGYAQEQSQGQGQGLTLALELKSRIINGHTNWRAKMAPAHAFVPASPPALASTLVKRPCHCPFPPAHATTSNPWRGTLTLTLCP